MRCRRVCGRAALTAAAAAAVVAACKLQRRAVTLLELAKAFADINAGAGDDGGDTAPRQQQQQQQQQHAHTQPWRHAARVSRDRPPAPPPPPSSLLSMSTTYAEHVAMLAEPALHGELEEQRQRSHYGNMVSCLLEVATRLRDRVLVVAATTSSHTQAQQQQDNDNNDDNDNDTQGRIATTMRYMCICADEAAARVSTSVSYTHCRSDRLLESLLRALARLDLTGVERDLTAWLQSPHGAVARLRSSSNSNNNNNNNNNNTCARGRGDVARTADEHTRDTPPHWLAELSCLLQMWLLARAPHLSVAQCVGVLHLLVQQRLVHHHALLVTLTDTLVLQRRALTQLATLALVFDAMLRYQMYVVRTQRALRGTSSGDADGGASAHAVWNARVYAALAEQFVHVLRDGDEDSDGGTRGATDALLSLSPSSFLFLTRALALLRFFDRDVVSTLLRRHVGLAAYLQRHPEQFYGPVMLLGRSENVACDVRVLRVLLGNMTMLLQRRGRVYSGTPSSSPPRRQQHDDADVGHVRCSDDDDDGVMSLLSGDDSDNGDKNSTAYAARGDSGDGTPPATATRSFMLSLVDVHAFASFLDALWRQYRLATTQLRATAQTTSDNNNDNSTHRKRGDGDGDDDDVYTHAMLTRDMRRLLVLLLDDVQRGVPDLHTALCADSSSTSAMVERLLLLLLRVTATLDSEHSNDGDDSSSNSNKDNRTATNTTTQGERARLVRHAFVVELVYAWTRHVRRRVTVVAPASSATRAHDGSSRNNNNNNNSNNNNKTRLQRTVTMSLSWQAQARTLLRLLLQHGLLTRIRTHHDNDGNDDASMYVMPSDVVSGAPRVAEAMATLAAELQRRRRQQQHVYASQRTVTTAVMTSRDTARAIFSRFSDVMSRIEHGNSSGGGGSTYRRTRS